MFQRDNRKKLDARKIDQKTKKAAIIGDFLEDDEESKIKGEEAVPKPEGTELTPVRPLPGAPKGMKGEVEEEFSNDCC